MKTFFFLFVRERLILNFDPFVRERLIFFFYFFRERLILGQKDTPNTVKTFFFFFLGSA